MVDEDNNRRITWSLTLGLSLLAGPLMTVLFGWLSLVAGGRVTAAAAAAGVAAMAAVIAGAVRAWKVPSWLGGVALLLVALCFGYASLFRDLSWDGQAYHQPAVRALVDGWNPYWQGPLSLARPDNLWVNHYPKAAWLAEAAITRALGTLEPAKGLQGVLLLAAASLLHAALRLRTSGPRALAGAVLLAANPVALAQLPSFYVDGLNASLMTCLLGLTLLLWWRPQHHRVLLPFIAGALVFMINLKFTGVPYVICYTLGVAGLLAVTGRVFRPLLGVGAGALVLGVCVLGFDPYVTNLVRHGHPFYPVRGPGAVDFLSPQLVPAFHQRWRLDQLQLTLLSRSSNRNEMPAPKWPLTVTADERAALAYADIRIGGFGPLFGAATLATLVTSLAALLLASRARARGRPFTEQLPLLGAATLILFSALCTPGAWWARYVPQLWFLPAGLVVLGGGLSRPLRGLRLVTGALLLANLLLVAEASNGGQLAATRALGAGAPVSMKLR